MNRKRIIKSPASVARSKTVEICQNFHVAVACFGSKFRVVFKIGHSWDPMACGSLIGNLSDLSHQIGANCMPPPCCGSPCSPMGCGPSTMIGNLSDLVHQIGPPCGAPPPCGQQCCPPCYFPVAQVTMTCPPPIMAPTIPCPVKPLQLPCPRQTFHDEEESLSPEEADRSRYDNFYNGYNIDWHNSSAAERRKRERPWCTEEKQMGQTLDGKSPCLDDYGHLDDGDAPLPGCPTGFKPCSMKLTPPAGCDPCGVWCAQVQPCPPKPKAKKSNKYKPGPCNRPGCKHWNPKEGPCVYDDPCKAHCFNHPPGMKPSGRFP